jgi:hypothetical protein
MLLSVRVENPRPHIEDGGQQLWRNYLFRLRSRVFFGVAAIPGLSASLAGIRHRLTGEPFGATFKALMSPHAMRRMMVALCTPQALASAFTEMKLVFCMMQEA